MSLFQELKQQQEGLHPPLQHDRYLEDSQPPQRLNFPSRSRDSSGVPLSPDHTASFSPEKQKQQCPICPYRTPYLSNLKRHILFHSGEKPFACHLCSHRCNDKTNLQKHLLTHTEDKPFNCSYCDYKSIRKDNFRLHLTRYHPEMELPE